MEFKSYTHAIQYHCKYQDGANSCGSIHTAVDITVFSIPLKDEEQNEGSNVCVEWSAIHFHIGLLLRNYFHFLQ